MKKLFTITIVAVIASAFTSCKKDYTCTCTYKDAQGIDRVNKGEYHGYRSQARKACQDQEDYLNTVGTYVYCGL